ncbi:hypothetical protein [Sphingobium olei]|uniref:DUF4398 domain-containing protein n=1 Tax=Sphingobium olei TaxID=420955 RepID=A0ABW3P7U0_9SPHN
MTWNRTSAARWRPSTSPTPNNRAGGRLCSRSPSPTLSAQEATLANPDYRALAAQAHSDAESATLDNVRDRFLRAESAWLTMARRQDATDAARARRDAETHARNPTVPEEG